MCRHLKRIFLLLIVFLLAVQPLFANAEFEKGSKAAEMNNINIPFTVKEQNGVQVKNYFFRRSIALEKGTLFSLDDICVTENDVPIRSSVERLERHRDGSISWLLVSAVVDLKPNEIKHLVIKKSTPEKGTIKVEKNSSNLTAKCKDLTVVCGGAGITSIKYKGVEQLKEGSINIYAVIGDNTYTLNSSELTVWKQTDCYTRLRMKGYLNDHIQGEIVLTLTENSNKLEIEHRITVLETVNIFSTGLKIGVKYQDAEPGTLIRNNVLNSGTMNLVCYDIERFNGGASRRDETGYIIRDNSIDLAPIVHNRNKTYWDGLTRTSHLSITFEDDAEELNKTLKTLPAVKFNPEQFVKAGKIKTTETGGLTDDALESLRFAYDNRNNMFEAGAIPRVINSKLKIVDSYDSQAGEVLYNMGQIYMQTCDSDIFRFIDECTEARADIVIYKGKYHELVGEERTRMGQFTDSGAFCGHPYYGTHDGLYMGYILTGNEYYGEIYEMCMEHDLEYMYDIVSCDSYVPVTWYWSEDTSTLPFSTDYYESRGIIRARCYYNAYLHFGDEKYLRAARNIVKWAKNTQWPSGSFIQATYHNGTPFTHEGQVQYPHKDYISLYGLRGLAQVAEMDRTDKDAWNVMIKFADYLCVQNEKFGPGFWYPNGDVNVYATNENNTRGKSPTTDILAIDYLSTAYSLTKNDRYLENICSLLRNYMGSATGGFGYWITPQENTPWVVSTEVDASRGTTLFTCSDDLMVMFNENRSKIVDMGYEDVALVFTQGAKKADDAKLIKYDYPEVTQNVFEYNGTKVFFAANNYAPYSLDWSKDLKFVFSGNKLWQGEKNKVSNVYSVSLEKFTEQYQTFSAIERPVYVDEISGEAEINIDEYNKDKIKLTYSGGCELGLKIENGIFEIADGNKYDVSVTRAPNGNTITVKKGGAYTPKGGCLYIKLDANGKFAKNIGMDAINGTSLEGLSPDASLNASQIENAVKNVFGETVKMSSESPVWKDFAPDLAASLIKNNNDVFDRVGYRTSLEVLPKGNLTDEEEIEKAAEAVQVKYDGDKLCADVFLAKKSLYNCDVNWETSDEKILDTEGRLYRNNIDKEEITLTATISKNGKSKKKSFVIPLKEKENILHTPSPDIPTTEFEILPQTGNDIEVTFTIIPKKAPIDGIIILGDGDSPVDSLTTAAYFVRFAPTGIIDSVDYYWAQAKNNIVYEVGKKYKIRVVIHADDSRYDAWVTPEGETEEILLATGCQPRYTGNTVKKVDRMWLWTSGIDTYELVDCDKYSYEKKETKDNYLYNRYNLMFGIYNTDDNAVYPSLSDNGLALNWLNLKSSINTGVGSLNVHIGEESSVSEDINIMDVLKKAHIIGDEKDENDIITVSDMARIINIRNSLIKE